MDLVLDAALSCLFYKFYESFTLLLDPTEGTHAIFTFKG